VTPLPPCLFRLGHVIREIAEQTIGPPAEPDVGAGVGPEPHGDARTGTRAARGTDGGESIAAAAPSPDGSAP
jgi:hypothetical protein